MDKLIRQEWIKALRSGEYKRCVGQLHLSNGFNCLGVLCDLHAKATAGMWELFKDSRIDWRYLGCCNTVSFEVIKWAGLKPNSRYHIIIQIDEENKETGEKKSTDIDLNVLDLNAATFDEMADLIEKGRF